VELLAKVFEAAKKEVLTQGEKPQDPVLLRRLDHRQKNVLSMFASRDFLTVRAGKQPGAFRGKERNIVKQVGPRRLSRSTRSLEQESKIWIIGNISGSLSEMNLEIVLGMCQRVFNAESYWGRRANSEYETLGIEEPT
jgi:hypothetical protein